jgi:hypothetical protein
MHVKLLTGTGLIFLPLASEYAVTPDYALTQMPLSFALMLVAAAHRRNGGRFASQSYAERDALAEIKKEAQLSPRKITRRKP